MNDYGLSDAQVSQYFHGKREMQAKLLATSKAVLASMKEGRVKATKSVMRQVEDRIAKLEVVLA